MKLDDNKATYSTAEAAQVLGMSQLTVMRWCSRQAIPAVKLGRVWMISRETLEGIINGTVKVKAPKEAAGSSTR